MQGLSCGRPVRSIVLQPVFLLIFPRIFIIRFIFISSYLVKIHTLQDALTQKTFTSNSLFKQDKNQQCPYKKTDHELVPISTIPPNFTH